VKGKHPYYYEEMSWHSRVLWKGIQACWLDDQEKLTDTIIFKISSEDSSLVYPSQWADGGGRRYPFLVKEAHYGQDDERMQKDGIDTIQNGSQTNHVKLRNEAVADGLWNLPDVDPYDVHAPIKSKKWLKSDDALVVDIGSIIVAFSGRG